MFMEKEGDDSGWLQKVGKPIRSTLCVSCSLPGGPRSSHAPLTLPAPSPHPPRTLPSGGGWLGLVDVGCCLMCLPDQGSRSVNLTSRLLRKPLLD